MISMKPAASLIFLSLGLFFGGCDPRPTGGGATPPAKATAGKPLTPGEMVPDFIFTSHDGSEMPLSSLRPRAVLVTFIFTRCTTAEFCPRMSLKFRETRAALDATAHRDTLEFLSITLDPENDSPAALSAYAKTFDARPGQWRFARCQPDVLSLLKEQFGVRAAPAGPNGAIEHNLITALIAPDGRLQKIWEGNTWTTGEIAAELERVPIPDTGIIANRDAH